MVAESPVSDMYAGVFTKFIVPFDATLMSVPEAYWSRLRKRLADEVVIEEGEEVPTIEKVNVGPVTPLIVVVATPEPPE